MGLLRRQVVEEAQHGLGSGLMLLEGGKVTGAGTGSGERR